MRCISANIIHGELQKFHCLLGFLSKSAFGLAHLKEAVLCNKGLLRGETRKCSGILAELHYLLSD